MTSAIDPVELARLANLFCFKHCVDCQLPRLQSQGFCAVCEYQESVSCS